MLIDMDDEFNWVEWWEYFVQFEKRKKHGPCKQVSTVSNYYATHGFRSGNAVSN